MSIFLIANHSTQFIARELKTQLPESIVTEADYDSVIPSLMTLNQGIDHVVVLLDSSNIRTQFLSMENKHKGGFGTDWSRQMHMATKIASERASHIWLTMPPKLLGETTNAAIREDQFSFHLNQIQQSILALVKELVNVHIVDLETLMAYDGLGNCMDQKLKTLADHPYTLPFTRKLAIRIAELINIARGKVRKCCILDLDNTLWGGIIGDDGLEGIAIGRDGVGRIYHGIQLWAKSLRNRGIILAICSKNTESVAREPFESHPEMILRLDDIAVFVANWQDKASNIRYIQEVLNIGFDAMVFVDDNPMERALVKGALPEVCTPELPEAPELFLPYLESLNLFDNLGKGGESNHDRTKQYQAEALRVQNKNEAHSIEEFLEHLDMRASIQTPFSVNDHSRISELFLRSNQFNLTTIRYTEADLKKMAEDDSIHTFSFRLSDKFGDHGIISLVIAQAREQSLQIQAWVMSCRVLKRGMEQFVFNTLLASAEQFGCSTITGEYIPTVKNTLVRDLYPKLGFERLSPNQYSIRVDTAKPLPTSVQNELT